MLSCPNGRTPHVGDVSGSKDRPSRDGAAHVLVPDTAGEATARTADHVVLPHHLSRTSVSGSARRRSEQQPVHRAEERGIRAAAERQRHDHDGRPAAALQQMRAACLRSFTIERSSGPATGIGRSSSKLAGSAGGTMPAPDRSTRAADPPAPARSRCARDFRALRRRSEASYLSWPTHRSPVDTPSLRFSDTDNR
jgi:hypothetical protein